jgi:hypothetical protein
MNGQTVSSVTAPHPRVSVFCPEYHQHASVHRLHCPTQVSAATSHCSVTPRDDHRQKMLGIYRGNPGCFFLL